MPSIPKSADWCLPTSRLKRKEAMEGKDAKSFNNCLLCPAFAPYSSPLLPQVSAARAKRLFASLAQALAAVRDLGARVLERAREWLAVAGSSPWTSTSGTLHGNTHRPVTNVCAHRHNDLQRVSHGATRFGRQTNHSDGDDHVSTIRVSQGQGQRVPCSLPSSLEIDR